MITTTEKIQRLDLMNKVVEATMLEGLDNPIKQTLVEDDKWHGQLVINYYDSDEFYKNIEPLYSVTCTDWCWKFEKRIPYGYIQVYKRIANSETVLKTMTVEDAQKEYNN